MRSWLVVILSIMFVPIWSDEAPNIPTSLAVDPATTLFDALNVVHHYHYESRIDHVVRCADPFPIRRVFVAGDQGKQKSSDWRFHEDRIYVEVQKGGRHPTIWWIDSGGAVLHFTPPWYWHLTNHGGSWEAELKDTPGLCNTSAGPIGGKTYLRNIRLKFEPHTHSFTVTLGDGEQRIYSPLGFSPDYESVQNRENRHRKEEVFGLKKIIRPNGNHLLHIYDAQDRLTEIQAKDSLENQVFGWAKFHYEGKETRVARIVTSDEQTIEYEYTWQYPSTRLKRVRYTDTLEERYSHHKAFTGDDKDRYGFVREGPLSIQAAITYEPGQRPTHLYRPIGQNDALYSVAHLQEHVLYKKETSWHGNSISQHKTNIPMAKWSDLFLINNRLRYHYSLENQLNLIERCDGEGPILNRECFFWNADKLDRHILLGDGQQALFCRGFEYDERGNVITEWREGNLTGEGQSVDARPWFSNRFRLGNRREGDYHVSDAERYPKRYWYSTDRFNNLLKEKYDDIEVVYDYLPNTDLVTKKCLSEKGEVKEEHRFTYDDNHLLTRHQSYDGFRTKIKTIYPRKDFPGYGMPEVIEESYLENGQEKLLKKERLTYSNQNQIVSREIYDAKGDYRYTQHYTYSLAGQLLSETDPLGNTTTYIYDTARQLVEKKTPTTLSKMQYDACGRLVEQLEYDERGTIKRLEKRYDPLDRLIYESETGNGSKTYQYDALGHLASITMSPILSLRGWQTPFRSFKRDALGNVLTEIDENGGVIRKQYNDRSQVTKMIHPDQTEEKFVYSINGELKSHTDITGLKTVYERDYRDRPLSILVYDKNDHLLKGTYHTYQGEVLTSTCHPDGSHTTYLHDGAGRIIEENHEGARTTYAYDSLGRQCEEIQWEGNHISTQYHYVYDDKDRLIREEVFDENNHLISWKAYTYDFDNRRIRESEGGDEAVKEYGLFGLTSITDGEGYRTSFSYDPTASYLNQEVLLVEQFDPLGRKTRTFCDAQDRPLCVEKENEKGQLVDKTHYRYDRKGNKTEEVHLVFVEDKEQSKYRLAWKYDRMDRPTLTEEGDGNLHKRKTEYCYNALGQLATIIKPSGITIKRTYDPLGRLFTESADDFQDTYTYDLGDRLLRIDSSNQPPTIRSYDNRGHLSAEWLANGLYLEYEHGDHGNLNRLTLPDHSSISYSYQGPYLADLHRNNYSFEYTYNSRGLLSSMRGPHSYSLFSYDQNGQTVWVDAGLFQQKLAYDPAGNISHIDTTDPVNTYSSQFNYDALNQLTHESSVFKNTYSYDSLGNRLSQNEIPYAVDPFNQLTSTQALDFTYDGDGHPITVNEGSYRYDSRGRLIEISDENVYIAYTYDSFHRRLSKKLHKSDHDGGNQSDEVRFLFADQNEIGTVDSSGNILTFRPIGASRGAEIGGAPLLELGSTTLFPIYDYHGNTVLLQRDTETPIELYRYSAFGEHQILTPQGMPLTASSCGNPYLFQSKYYDKESDLILFGRRYYHPTTGRWLTPDPLGFSEGPNLYLYCHNQPLTLFDLYGLSSEDSEGWWAKTRSAASEMGKGFGEGLSHSPAWIASGVAGGWRGDPTRKRNEIYEKTRPLEPYEWSNNWSSMSQSERWYETGRSAGCYIGGTLTSALAASTVYFGSRAIPNSLTPTAVAAEANTMRTLSKNHPPKPVIPRTHIQQSTTSSNRAFTKGNFRDNLKEHTGLSPEREMDAHHVLPQKFRRDFVKKGINIDNPKYGAWWERRSHRSAARAYNDVWEEFLDTNPNFTERQASELGKQMMSERGIPTNY